MSRHEMDKVLGHADEADGIEEYDNPLPTWWLGLFVVTVIFGVFYAVDYHFVSHRSIAGDYNAEVADAVSRWPPAQAMVLPETPEVLAAGKEIFQTNCSACHGAEMQGGIGPNLTDTTWIHGGKIGDITGTITNGVAEKGMPTWGPVLGAQRVAQVAAYIHAAGGGQ